MSGNALQTLTTNLATRLGIGDSGMELADTLKATAFRAKDGTIPSDAQMTALLIVANQYGLNPWTKEIYAFPDKNNGIIPVVGIDGWSRIINEHQQFDGMEFRTSETYELPEGAKAQAPQWIECVIYRKDRSKPTIIREYLDECYRAPFKSRDGYPVLGPWQTHPKRFLRHKSIAQCARIAFGFVGIFDQDEAERIVEATVVDNSTGVVEKREVKVEPWPADLFAERLVQWRDAIKDGKATAAAIIAKAKTKYPLTAEQEAAIMKPIEKVEGDVTDVVDKNEKEVAQ